jgi:DNA helicase-2/ATP-dependent DNA helicase PcrA
MQQSVFVLNVVDGCIPSDLGTGTSAEIEEERRLLYVAMTRAKDDLHLIVPNAGGDSAPADHRVGIGIASTFIASAAPSALFIAGSAR